MNTRQLVLSLFCNLFVVFFVAASCAAIYLHGGKGNMMETGRQAFRYFTVDSNVLCALACLCVAVFDVCALIRGGGTLPRWMDLFKLVGAAAVGVTFFTVLFYLLPVSRFNFKMMYAGRNLFLHGLCPLAAMLSWAFFERSGSFSLGWTLLALIPTAVYGAVYGWMVLVSKRWEDFYSFNVGGRWYLSVGTMLALTFLLAAGLRALRG